MRVAMELIRYDDWAIEGSGELVGGSLGAWEVDATLLNEGGLMEKCTGGTLLVGRASEEIEISAFLKGRNDKKSRGFLVFYSKRSLVPNERRACERNGLTVHRIIRGSRWCT